MRTQSKGIIGILMPDGSPTSVLALGICCSMAVTTQISDTLMAGIVLTAVSVCSGILLSVIRRILPQQIDIVVETLVVMLLVMLSELVLNNCGWELSTALTSGLGIIAFNSVLFSRRRPFALRHNPASSAFEGLVRGVAYTAIMLVIALLRDLLGFVGLMAYPPAALLIFGIILWVLMPDVEEDRLQPRFNTADACRTGLCTFAVLMLAMPLIWLLNRYVLDAGALAWLDPSFEDSGLDDIKLASTALVAVAMSRLVKLISAKVSSSEHLAMDVYFPLVSVNAAFISAWLIPFGECSFALLLVNAALAGLACFVALAAFAAISDRTWYSDVPKGLRGPGIAFIIAGLAGIAAMAFLGIKI